MKRVFWITPVAFRSAFTARYANVPVFVTALTKPPGHSVECQLKVVEGGVRQDFDILPAVDQATPCCAELALGNSPGFSVSAMIRPTSSNLKGFTSTALKPCSL